MNVFWGALVILIWIFLGFIAMGVLSTILIKNYTFDHWRKVKNMMRISAIILGPFLFSVAIGYILIYAIVLMPLPEETSPWTVPDWIIAGFRHPPVKSRKNNENAFPTVSP